MAFLGATTIPATGGGGASPPFAISDTTGLQSALDGKAANSHQHAGEDIASGTVAAVRLGSGTANNTSFLRGDGTWTQPSLDNLAAGTIPSSVPLRFSQSNTTGTSSSQPERFISNSAMVDSVPASWSYLVRVAGSNYLSVNATAIILGTAQSGSIASIALWRAATGLVLNAGQALSVRVQSGTLVSVPTGGSWTTLGSVSGLALGRMEVFVTGHGFAEFTWDGTTLTKERGASTLVVSGSPGPTEIGFRVSSSNVQASNGTGTTRTASMPLQVGQ